MELENRLGFVGVIVEDRGQVSRVNGILSEFAPVIRGRIGVPDRETGIGVIGLIVEGTNDKVGALTGRLGNIKGVLVKSALVSKAVQRREEIGRIDV